jgi:hypothetical protein
LAGRSAAARRRRGAPQRGAQHGLTYQSERSGLAQIAVSSGATPPLHRASPERGLSASRVRATTTSTRPSRRPRNARLQGSQRALYRSSKRTSTTSRVLQGRVPRRRRGALGPAGGPDGGDQAAFTESPERFAPDYDPGQLAELAEQDDEGEVGALRLTAARPGA